MNRVFRTSDLPASDRFAAWHEIVGNRVVPVRMTSGYTSDFVATARFAGLGPVAALATEHPPLKAERTPVLIRQSDPEVYLLILAIAGRRGIGHGRNTTTALRGDLTLFHSSVPTTTTGDPSARCERDIVLAIPHSELAIGFDRLRPLVGLPVSTRAPGIGSVVAALLRTCLDTDPSDPSEAVRLGSLAIDLVSVMFAQQLRMMDKLPIDKHQNALLAQAQAFIQARLADPALTPETVAAAHHLSLRSLQRLFQANGTTIADYIRTMRLERCRRDLADPFLAALPISTIARRWGFAVPHLSRLFKQRYGKSPSEFRRHARPAEPL